MFDLKTKLYKLLWCILINSNLNLTNNVFGGSFKFHINVFSHNLRSSKKYVHLKTQSTFNIKSCHFVKIKKIFTFLTKGVLFVLK